MCVSQLRDYCSVMRYRFEEDIEANDEVLREKGTYNGMWFTAKKKEMKDLAENGNTYAKAHLKNQT